MDDTEGVRIAVEGCGHGTLDAIYSSVTASCRNRGWDGVDVLIICGDFQATRNAADLCVMSVPAKYRELGDFPAYYRGQKTAPYLTIFIGGNHESSSYLRELYYGGWVAPNIYYMGKANVLRLGPLRIAGLSGTWSPAAYTRTHCERLPFDSKDIRSSYHVREFDVRKLLQIRGQVDVGLSHDWPNGIEHHGDVNSLYKVKPHFKTESKEYRLGSPAAQYVMDRLRPAHWFSAHLHCKYPAIIDYDPPGTEAAPTVPTKGLTEPGALTNAEEPAAANPDEIDLDMDEDGDVNEPNDAPTNTEPSTANPDEIDLDIDEHGDVDEPSADAALGVAQDASGTDVPDDVRAQLPASFAKPAPRRTLNPGQPVPPSITNTRTRFLSLDKCLPGRKFLQLAELSPLDPKDSRKYPPSSKNSPMRYRLQYDPEWLAITRAFAPYLKINDREAQTPPDLGEEAYREMISKEWTWVYENIEQKGRLKVPKNFTVTAPPYKPGDPRSVSYQPEEYTNPQTTAFCKLLGIPDLWDASEEERTARKGGLRYVPAPSGQGGSWGRGKGGDRGSRGGGGGSGRGRGGGRGRGRGGGRGGRG